MKILNFTTELLNASLKVIKSRIFKSIVVLFFGLLIIILLGCILLYCLDLKFEYNLNFNYIANLDYLFNNLKLLNLQYITPKGVEGLTFADNIGESSSLVTTDTRLSREIMPSNLQDSVNHLNNNIDDLIEATKILKNKLVVFCAKNNIVMQIEKGMLNFYSSPQYEASLFIKKSLLEVSYEKLINAQVQAELFSVKHNQIVTSIEHSRNFFHDMLRTFPLLDQSYLDDIYNESLSKGGNRFIHDPLNRPSGFNAVTDRTPSPDLLENNLDNMTNKRQAEMQLENKSKIAKNIIDQLPKDVFKKP